MKYAKHLLSIVLLGFSVIGPSSISAQSTSAQDVGVPKAMGLYRQTEVDLDPDSEITGFRLDVASKKPRYVSGKLVDGHYELAGTLITKRGNFQFSWASMDALNGKWVNLQFNTVTVDGIEWAFVGTFHEQGAVTAKNGIFIDVSGVLTKTKNGQAIWQMTLDFSQSVVM